MLKKIETEEKAIKLLNICSKAGEILLECGAEVFRVEDTLERISKSYSDIDDINVFVNATTIIISLTFQGIPYTSIVREKKPGFQLDKVEMVNSFSRKFVTENISLEEAYEELVAIDKKREWKNSYKSICAGITSGTFSLMFGGQFLDFFAAFTIGTFVFAVFLNSHKLFLSSFLNNLLAGFLSSALAYLFLSLGIGNNLDLIIIGTLMPYVPGVIITNSIRDMLAGDYITGLMSSAHAVVTAIAIAFGVGIVLLINF